MPRWIPLESNPEVLTRFSRELGLPSTYGLSEVLSPDLLDIVPTPRLAVIFLFPTTLPPGEPDTQHSRNSNVDKQAAVKSPFFMKQFIANACGTIALLHAFCNNKDVLNITKGTFVDKYYDEAKDMNPEEKGKLLENSEELDKVQDGFARQGQTSVPNRDDNVDMHFVCFVHFDGWLYELDGRKERPTRYGKCTKDTLLEESFKVIQDSYMKKNPKEARFNVLALTPQTESESNML